MRSIDRRLTGLTIVFMAACSAPGEDPGTSASSGEGHRPVHWSYDEDGGPQHWADLTPAYAACGAGRNQSPIDLFAVAEGQIVGGGLSQRYGSIEVAIRRTTQVSDLLDNGHTIQVDAGGSHIELNDIELDLVQFHFHGPSEHRLMGRSFPLEIHFVHTSKDGALAVIGVFIIEGDANPELAKVVANLPEADDDLVRPPGVAIDIPGLLPTGVDTARYRYSGSMTTPPCTEGVRWVVFPNPIEASPEQIEAIRGRMPVNNRPLQALNGRLITLLRH